jgi:hypothetical protein
MATLRTPLPSARASTGEGGPRSARSLASCEAANWERSRPLGLLLPLSPSEELSAWAVEVVEKKEVGVDWEVHAREERKARRPRAVAWRFIFGVLGLRWLGGVMGVVMSRPGSTGWW